MASTSRVLQVVEPRVADDPDDLQILTRSRQTDPHVVADGRLVAEEVPGQRFAHDRDFARTRRVGPREIPALLNGDAQHAEEIRRHGRDDRGDAGRRGDRFAHPRDALTDPRAAAGGLVERDARALHTGDRRSFSIVLR